MFLVFGLVVADCSLYSQSNTVAYFQCSNISQKLESNKNDLELFLFKKQSQQTTKTPFQVVLLLLTDKDFCTIQKTVLFKTQTFIYQKEKATIAHYTFLNKLITSKEIVTVYT